MSTKKTSTPKTQSGAAKAATVKPISELAARIQYFNEQAQKVRLRDKHQQALDKLNDVKVNFEDTSFFPEQYSSKPKFTFQEDREILLSITQPEIVEEVRQFLLSKIESKMQELTAEILTK